jgi:PhnB protein
MSAAAGGLHISIGSANKRRDRGRPSRSIFHHSKEEPAMAVKPIPQGYRTVTPYLIVPDADRLIEFLKAAFGAQEAFPPMRHTDGKIMHADVKIGDSHVMLAEGSDQYPATETHIHLYMKDVDKVHQRATAAGGTSTRDPEDMFYGDRTGSVRDFAGNTWHIATHKEDVEPQELQRRAEEMFRQQKGQAA